MGFDAALEYLDNPIGLLEQDELSRGGYVENVCRILRTPTLTESNVFAIYGDWGAGKTSVKNLIVKHWEHDKEAPLTVEFNPWAFSSQKEVMAAFFRQVSYQIGKEPSGGDLSKSFQKLGAYLSIGTAPSFIGILLASLWTAPASVLGFLVGLFTAAKEVSTAAKHLRQLCEQSLDEIQQKLMLDLKNFGRPILIIIDDLDRLSGDQLLTMFQIVRQNVRLPSVNYLLLMDRSTVDEQLRQQGIGDKYIEKIVQFEFFLPHVSASRLNDLLRKGLSIIMGDRASEICWERWDRAWPSGLENIFTTMRRVKRFLHTLRFYVQTFKGDGVFEVDPVDLFILEAIRLHAPSVHKRMATECRAGVGSSASQHLILLRALRHDSQPFGLEILQSLKEVCPEERWSECERLVKELFPQLGSTNPILENDEWVRDGRICHPLFYDTYFQLDIPRGQLSQSALATLLNQINQGVDFSHSLHRLVEKTSLQETLRRLECNQEKIERQRISNLLAAIWNEQEDNASKNGFDRDFFDRDACQGFTRAVIRYKAPPEKRAEAVIDALNKSRAIYPAARFWRAEYVGRKENPNDRDLLFTSESLDRVTIAVTERLRKAVDEGLLIQNPELGSLLSIWPYLTTAEERDAWLKEQLHNDNYLVLILKGMINKGCSGEKTVYYISRKALTDLIPTYICLKDRLHRLQEQKLPRWDEFAVNQAIERIKEEENGLPERDYFL